MSKELNQFFPDTIAAQATPPGRGGITVIRISGSKVRNIIPALLKIELSPRQATYLPFYNTNNEVIDIGIAIFFQNPHSFTGEDVLELHGHGGPIVSDLLLQSILKLEVRLARAGEFSERAFLNNKIDLTQAEAIADLIDASSQQSARLAMRSLQGDFSRHIQSLNENIIQTRMYIEAAIDFSDEEIDFLSDVKLKQKVETILQELNKIEQQSKQGSLLREGINVVIAGKPNAGKSSLLNQLSGKEIAIVTPIAGTTRDILRDYIAIDGIPLHIIDTAGLRESTDIVEQEGIRRAYQEMEKADLVLYIHDLNEEPVLLNTLPAVLINKPIIFIKNKIDLINESPAKLVSDKYVTISLSAKTGVGLDLLKKHIKEKIGYQDNIEGIFLARRRHLDALSRAKNHVEVALLQLSANASGELIAEDLRLAQLALNEITGEFTADDLLGKIFANFCIGK